jgi:hypothetical protein
MNYIWPAPGFSQITIIVATRPVNGVPSPIENSCAKRCIQFFAAGGTLRMEELMPKQQGSLRYSFY